MSDEQRTGERVVSPLWNFEDEIIHIEDSLRSGDFEMTKDKKQLASDIVMNELLWYGGEQKSRARPFTMN